MPPKKPAAVSADQPAPSSSDAPMEKKTDNKTDAAALRKVPLHPSTPIMVKEALRELDSRKGASSQAVQNYIKQKYPSVDLVRLKYLVRKALKKGIENGTLVRPANSSEALGAMGKFRLAPKLKKSKTENMDPNVQNAPKPAKKPKKAGAVKKKDSTKEQLQEEANPKKSKKVEGVAASKKAEGTATSKGAVTKKARGAATSKKPKAKMAAENVDEGGSASTVTKVAKPGKQSKSKAVETGSDAPASKAPGKRGKKE